MLSRPGLPLVATLPIPDPRVAARALAHLPFPFLLHSALPDGRNRWSFFGADPFAVFGERQYRDALLTWRRLSACAAAGDLPDVGAPFTGGVVGYWAYDFGRRQERLPVIARDDLGLPDVLLGCYDVVGAWDHAAGRGWLFSSGLPLEGPGGHARARARLDRFLRRLDTGWSRSTALPKVWERPATLPSTFSPDGYRRAVEEIRERIRAGDIFQANLSQRWSCAARGADPRTLALALAESLATISPAPYAAFFGAHDHALASASPECFLRLRGRAVETRPIKGTRPRGADAAEDRRLAAELLGSEKDRAENIMIVDVLRNDLGRVCQTGSVEAAGLCELESFPQVHHLTSTVRGTLRDGLDPFDLLHACFPGGSITGAPKIRAMEILEALEPVRRHVYTGSMGYVDWRGHADWSIAIRTALVTPGAVHFAAGGGITAESDPDREYHETLHKAEGMVRALQRVVGPVTLCPEMVEAP